MAENLGNDFSTTLAGAIADGTTTSVSVASGTGAPAESFRIRIDNELLLVTSTGAGTNWTVTRGIEGTTAVAHASGAPVAHVITKAGLDTYAFQAWVIGVPTNIAAGLLLSIPANYQLRTKALGMGLDAGAEIVLAAGAELCLEE